jgi:hypothetical protein
MVPIVIVVVVPVAVYARIRDSHLQWVVQSESDNGIAANPDGPPTCLAAVDRPHNGSHEAVITARFDAVWLGSQGITLPIHNHRFQVEYEVIVGRNANHQFGIGAARHGNPPILTPDVLIDGSVVNAIVFLVDVYRFSQADWNHRAGLKPRDRSPVTITVPVSILGGAKRRCNQHKEPQANGGLQLRRCAEHNF